MARSSPITTATDGGAGEPARPPAAGPARSGAEDATGRRPSAPTIASDLTDPGLALAGQPGIAWAGRSMPVLRMLQSAFAAEPPFAGLKVAACLHVTAETAILVQALTAGGAQVHLAASNPLSTQDDIA